MGNRALVQFVNKEKDCSPTVYLHWHGNDVGMLLGMLKELMEGRNDDLSYCTARFIGLCHEHIEGNLSLGVWNSTKKLTKKDSHGDNGVFIVYLDTWKVEHIE